ncbi:dipeptide transport system permease protein DppB [Streptomyces sp. L-9-10]|uniref:ABC transporter permease n=1 Tax=unclassified Streptomyces TaxID=2593676 RepID=UPI0010EF4705|nr:ABC transporter permease [Streptomyces sp. L-9-10]RYJ25358.1 dipeptide transport system permease protein DppB [Streptomyces sp. L-9-10]
MARRIGIRILLGLFTVTAVVLLTFVLQYVVPGDPARSIAGPKASPEVLAEIRGRLRLDDPLWSQLGHYLGSVATGDLGTSYSHDRPVLSLILERLPATAVLAAAALTVELVLGGLWGLWEALRPKRSWLLATINVGLLSMPVFSLGFLLLLFFGYKLPVFPIDGGTGPAQIVLPALTLGILGAPYYANVVRDSVREALSSAYVRTAVAKGLSRRRIVTRHVLRNTASPVTTLLGMDVAVFLSGVVFVETIFGWPGIGQMQTSAFAALDRPLLTGTVIVAASLVVTANLLVDLVRTAIDPRTASETP